MKFGLILLVLVLACSLVGSFLLQGQSPEYYEANFPNAAGFIMAVHADHIFTSFYFIIILALLGVNLILCSLVRYKVTHKLYKEGVSINAAAGADQKLSGRGMDRLAAFLNKRRFKKAESGGATVYYKNRIGHYGSFITHLSILLTFLFAAIAMYGATAVDYNVMPGESQTLEDGTQLFVESFRTTDDEGLVDYVSVIHVAAPDGTVSESAEISVNYPFSFQGHKYYQQSFGAAASISVLNVETGVEDTVMLDDPGFLTLDGENGVMFQALYPDFITDEEGRVAPLSGSDWTNPIYQISTVEGETTQNGMIEPGQALSVGGVLYSFNEPAFYPGILVKTNPPGVMALLYACFGLMIIGLWLCFFQAPVYVVIKDGCYALRSPKSVEGLKNEIDIALLGDTEG